MAALQLESLSKRYGAVIAADHVTLDVPHGEFLVLLGPSGCGKTTTLRMVAGLIDPTAGAIRIASRDVTRLPAWRRNIGLVFQNYALFPHMTVAENVAFGLEMRRTPRADVASRVHDALALVRLDSLADRLPRQLSGGQQQRVALARALVFHPDVLLLDEPLSNLDAKLRNEVRLEIRRLQQKLGLTTIMVTHDQEEALTMADRLVVMNAGAIRQVGTQRDLYERPADRFVAGFVGRSSFLAGQMRGDMLTTAAGLQIRSNRQLYGPAELALRPERVSLGLEPIHADNCFPGEVEFVSYMGGLIDIHVKLSDTDRIVAQRPNLENGVIPGVGDHVHAAWSANTPVFPA